MNTQELLSRLAVSERIESERPLFPKADIQISEN